MITELVNMMRGQKTYEFNAKMITMQDQTLDQAINSLGQIA